MTIEELGEEILGTCSDLLLEEYAEEHDIEFYEVEDQLMDLNIERCPECEWWVESGELVDESWELQSCENCRI